MKRTLISLSIGFFLSACNSPKDSSAGKPASNDSLQKATVYECPMKCEGKVYDKPGNCSVCGMELVAKK